MLLCAQIAWLNPAQQAADLPALLWSLDSDYREKLNKLAWATASSVDEPLWLGSVRERLQAVTWPALLNSAWAWEVVLTLSEHAHPSSPRRSERTNVLLVKGNGVTADLMLEVLDDYGTGTFYLASVTSLAWRDDDFRRAEQAAVPLCWLHLSCGRI